MRKLAVALKISALMAAAILVGGGCAEDDDDDFGSGVTNYKVEKVVSATDDSQIKAIFDQTNSFRTGNEAYYLNSDNKTNKNLVGKLGKLTLDENLCKAAAIRAEEIVNKFAHERHNGSSCFTVLKDCSIRYGFAAENIAAGSSTGSATFNQWKEDGRPYSGQGHRRSMLSESATKIGLAYAYSSEAPYKYYWVMELTD